MSELESDLRHYRARLSLWWSDRQRRGAEGREQQRAIDQASQKQLSNPQGGGWYQDPHGPPGYMRWWDGERWSEHTQVDTQARKGGTSGLEIAGFVTLLLGLFFWPIFIAPFVIGIIVAARGNGSAGAILIVLSVLGPVLSIVGCAALIASGS